MSKATIPVCDATTDQSRMTSLLDEAGCLVVHNVFDDTLREQIVTELEEPMQSAMYSGNDSPEEFYPGKTQRLTALVSRSAGVHQLVMHPVTTQLCNHHLLPNCERYNLHVTAALKVGPGARSQILHREEDPFTFFPLPRPNLVIASMAALSDFRADNGGTLLVPGSHKWDADRKATEGEVAAAEMPSGSMLFWLGGTLHGAGANTSDDWRYGVILSYSLGWLRQEENQYMDLTSDDLSNLPDDVKDRAGMTMHGALGLYDPRIRGSEM